jgi:hypothetical protein
MSLPYFAVTTDIAPGVATPVTVEGALDVVPLPPPQPDNVPVSTQMNKNKASFFMSPLLI